MNSYNGLIRKREKRKVERNWRKTMCKLEKVVLISKERRSGKRKVKKDEKT